MPRRPDYLARVRVADDRYKVAEARLAATAEARRQAIGAAVANGIPIIEVAQAVGNRNYESVRRIAAQVNGPRPVGRPPKT